MVECYGPLLCKVSGPRGRLVKHEDEGAFAEDGETAGSDARL